MIEYPNLDSNQNDDLGSTISGNITIDQGEYQKPNIVFTASTTTGSNGWVQSASITSNITTQTGIYEALYCTTTSSNCTPNTTPSISDNSFNVTLGSNASVQKVCVRVTDEYNQITEHCSNAYSVDTMNPIVSITNATSTQNSISVTVRGSDSHSGIYQYRFSSNGGSSYTTVSSTSSTYTYTFNNLNSGTTYNIRVQAVDRSGRTSSAASRSVATESANAADVILAGKNIDNSRSGVITGVLTEDTTGTVYSVQDDWGTSYVYAGAPTDNWVYFAGFYWRIIRINGDGSIRMIYAGTDPEDTTGTGTQIQTSDYNSLATDNAYVGYMYGSTGASSYASTHANTNDSTIKGILDTWYQNNLASYLEYISTEAGFCNDRRIATPSETWWTSDTKRGYGTNATAYAPYSRILITTGGWNTTSQTPMLECSQSSDMFTVSESSKGNRALDYPIGLITVDEVVLAGGFGGERNASYYLNTGEYYWTISPSTFNSSISHPARAFIVADSGSLSNSNVNNSTFGVRPVINLRADVTLSGNGTSSNPYRVS